MSKKYETNILPKNDNFKGASLDKLAQLTECPSNKASKGIDFFKKLRAYKYLQNRDIIFPLINLHSKLEKQYWHAYHCVDTIDVIDQRAVGYYCKTRICRICSRILTAKLMNGYLPSIKAMQDKYFVTLTFRSVSRDDLPHAIDRMIFDISKIIRHRQDNLRYKKLPIMNGVRKLECTFNHEKKTFHPHLHIVVDGFDNAKYIFDEWLRTHTDAVEDAQHMVKCDDKTTKELFKYFAKIIDGKHAFDAYSIDWMMQSMARRRIYQPFGNIRFIEEELDDDVKVDTELIQDDGSWVWFEQDWYNVNTGAALLGTSPDEDESFKKLCSKLVNYSNE